MFFFNYLWLLWVFVALPELFSSCSERRASPCQGAQALDALAGTPVPCTGRRVLTHHATREVQDTQTTVLTTFKGGNLQSLTVLAGN